MPSSSWSASSEEKQVCYQHISHTNKHNNNYRPWVGPKEVLFFYFLASFCFLLPLLLCKLCLTLANSLFSKDMPWEGLGRLSTTVSDSESSIDESSGHQNWTRRRGHSTICSKPSYIGAPAQSLKKSNRVQIPVWLTVSTCAFLLKTGHFLIYRLILTSLVPFFVSCTCLHCIFHCPKEKQH